MRTSNPFKRVALILFLIVLLPALFYSGYEINALSGTEGLIERIYLQQLDAILYSLNQFSWDVAANWASSIAVARREQRADALDRYLQDFFANTSSVKGVVFADSALGRVRLIVPASDNSALAALRNQVIAAWDANSEKLERLAKYQRLEYRKMDPVKLDGGPAGASRILLVFPAGLGMERPSYAGLILDQRTFIRDVLAVKLREVAGDEFTIAVFSGNDPAPVFSTEPVDPGAFRQKKLLWLFPEYTVGIVLKGMTVEEILRGRFYRSLGLIALLDIVLIAGVWVVYRSVRSEMELVRMKSDFISNVSHELRTPLSLIRMFAETLEMGRLRNEKTKREYYGTILRETERLTKLVNNILSFSRMEAGKRRFHFRPLDLNGTLRGVLETYERQLRASGFDLVTDLDEHLPPINGDEGAISEAIINLIDNAVKYSDRQRYLRVATASTNTGVVVEIEDHGIGIAPENHAKIFETFFRVSDGLVHNTKGSGLGLSMVKQIMDAHHGTTQLDSAPGRGSTFRLVFPFTDQLGG